MAVSPTASSAGRSSAGGADGSDESVSAMTCRVGCGGAVCDERTMSLHGGA